MSHTSTCFAVGALLVTLVGPSVAAGHETQRQYLSGRDKDHTVDWQFKVTSGLRSGEWVSLPVPSQWDVLGFGTLNYRKDRGEAQSEKGLYKVEFAVPAGWANKRVFLVFEGVMTDTTVTINGQLVGPTHQGGFYRFRYEVGGLLKYDGPNLLEVTVTKHSANESVNQAERNADYWVFGGIYRPVYLEAVPKEFVDRVAIDAEAGGAFTMDVVTGGAADGDTVEAQIVDLDGKAVGEAFSAPVQVGVTRHPHPSPLPEGEGTKQPHPSPLPGGEGTGTAQLATKIDSPKQWSAETPNLYRVEVRLKRGGKLVHQIDQRFGFRTIEVRDGDGIYVNGRRVVLKGVNRHSSWPDSGRALSDAVYRLDIETIKDMNMNAVRMSHYPPDVEFLDLCDELGLYVLDELAGWHHHYDTPTGTRLVEAMVTRDVNHPSILFWDNGNEGGFNKELDPVFDEFDPQHRRVLHPWEEFGGINTAHYLEYDRAKVASQGAATRHGPRGVYDEYEDTDDPKKYIYMPTEMLHGLYDGGGGAGLEDYWRMMTESPVLGGTFLWVFADEGIKRTDAGQIDTSGNEAPDGMVSPYREREGSFYTIKEIWSPIQVTRGKDGVLTIKNHYSFTDANQCQFTWELRRFKRPDETDAGHEVLASGTLDVPSIPPGETATMPRDLLGWLGSNEVSPQANSADALALRVEDPEGRELWTWVWPLDGIDAAVAGVGDDPARSGSDKAPSPQPSPKGRGGRTAEIKEAAGEVVVTSGDLEIRINRETGLLAGVKRGEGSFSFVHGPRPAIASPNDGSASAIFTLKDIAHKLDGPDAVVTATYDGQLQRVEWRMTPDGWLECYYHYQAKGPLEYCGVEFDYPEQFVEGKRWLGDGPYRVWKNRLRGNTLGVWENDYNNTVTGYSRWEYPEFKGCFAGVRWLQLRTIEGPITIVPGQSTAADGKPVPVYVQVLTPDTPPKELEGQTGAPLPEAGVAILNAIPPKGSKFKPAASTGPQGQLSEAAGEYSGSVSLYFGELP